MTYRIRPSGNSMWNVTSIEQSVSLNVRELIINRKLKTVHEGITNVAGVTSYQGFMEFETDKPLVIDNGVLTID